MNPTEKEQYRQFVNSVYDAYAERCIAMNDTHSISRTYPGDPKRTDYPIETTQSSDAYGEHVDMTDPQKANQAIDAFLDRNERLLHLCGQLHVTTEEQGVKLGVSSFEEPKPKSDWEQPEYQRDISTRIYAIQEQQRIKQAEQEARARKERQERERQEFEFLNENNEEQRKRLEKQAYVKKSLERDDDEPKLRPDPFKDPEPTRIADPKLPVTRDPMPHMPKDPDVPTVTTPNAPDISDPKPAPEIANGNKNTDPIHLSTDEILALDPNDKTWDNSIYMPTFTPKNDKGKDDDGLSM